MKPKDELGRRGEDRATDHLRASGFRVVERNWRCSLGEIDIVAYDGPCLVVVEVKTRSSESFGHPFESVTPAKLKRLHLLAREWVVAHEPPDAPPHVRRPRWRVDVVGIVWPPAAEPTIEHLREVA